MAIAKTVLVAEHKDKGRGPEITGVGRLTKLLGSEAVEFAVVISDRYQGQGRGTELLPRLVEIGRDEKITRIMGDILPENLAMIGVCRKLGFRINYDAAEGVQQAKIECS